MKCWWKHIIAALLLFLPSLLWAQFYTAGDDPGRLRWRTMETGNFKLIYPKGLDSLAKVYGRQLEGYRNPVGQSIRYIPGEYTRGKIPVVFHPCNSFSNASVAWAPRRMDIFSQPEAYEPTPVPWETMLSIHEQRHVAQMQFGLSHKLRPFNWIVGEMFNGASAGIFCYTGYLEGDAVIAETALTNSGRGRTSDFLNYYMIAFDQGDWRNLPKWAKGSYRRYTPNEYALGYMYFGGVRYFWDYPEIVGDTFRNAAKKPLKALFWRSHTIKDAIGENFWHAFDTVAVKTYGLWKEEADSRAPYMPVDTLVKTPRFYTRYDGLAATENGVIGYRSGMDRSREMVRIDYDGEKPKKVRQFSTYASNIKSTEDGEYIYWSESVEGERWSLMSRSVIRRADKNGRHVRTITHRNKYYNPSPSPDGSLVSVCEYPDYGGSFVVILDEDGKVVERHRMADGFQVVESAWLGSDLFITGLTSDGFGVYKLVNGDPVCIMQTLPVTISDFHSHDGVLAFTSDRSGVEELYELSPNGRLVQVTCTRYGANDYQYSADGKWLYYSAAQHDGELLSRTAVADLPKKEVAVSDIHHYAIADRLSEQESAFVYEETPEDSVTFSAERKFHKLPHAFNVHSWAPLCIDGSTILNQNVEDIVNAARLGATAIMQNRLGTLTGVVGYGINPDTSGELKDNGKKKWRNSLHGTFRYTGWYPVIEANIDFNDRAARLYRPLEFTNVPGKGAYISSFRSLRSDVPYVRGSIKVYIPWRWSKGGWYSGLTPQISYSVSNDTYTSGYLVYSLLTPDDIFQNRVYTGYKKGRFMPFQAMSASLRGYTMQGRASSAVYPRFGIGAEVGTNRYLGMKADVKYKSGRSDGVNFYSPSMYAFMYGYLPGVVPQQGIRLSVKYHHGFLDDGLFHSGSINPLPRGLSSNSSLMGEASLSEADAFGFTFDYAIPFWIGDPCLCHGLFHASNMILTPHFDGFTNGKGYLYSAGASLEIGMKSLFWIGVPFSIGVTCSYNGGSLWSEYTKKGVPMDHLYVGPSFSIDF